MTKFSGECTVKDTEAFTVFITLYQEMRRLAEELPEEEREDFIAKLDDIIS